MKYIQYHVVYERKLCDIFINFQADRDSLSLNLSTSQFYTSALTPISSTPPMENEPISIASSTPTSIAATTPVVELTEEVIFFENFSPLNLVTFIVFFLNFQ